MSREHRDRLFIVLFFVDFVISIVLAFFLAQAVNTLQLNIELTCENREFIIKGEDPRCDGVMP